MMSRETFTRSITIEDVNLLTFDSSKKYFWVNSSYSLISRTTTIRMKSASPVGVITLLDGFRVAHVALEGIKMPSAFALEHDLNDHGHFALKLGW